MYDKVSTNMNFVEREKNIEKFWEEKDIFKKSIDARKKAPEYTFMTDRRQPTANPTSVMY